MELKFQLHAKIQKPVDQVFDAVYNPKKITKYFATASASGPLDEGAKVIWNFADYPGDVPVTVKKMVPNQLIVLEWEAADRGYNTNVEMRFESLSKDETLVTIAEGDWHENQKALNASYGNCYGWMHMSCCLKAYLEHGINLREGFFHNPKLAQ